MNDASPQSENNEKASEVATLDQRVIDALDQMGVNHGVEPKSGDIIVLVEFTGNRTQQVHIDSITREFMGVEMRTISSIALGSEGPFDARTANFLLRENADLEFGAWHVIYDTENNHYAVFSVTVSAALRAKPLVDLIGMVASTADGTENRLTGLDQF
jgi:hypothetical protein